MSQRLYPFGGNLIAIVMRKEKRLPPFANKADGLRRIIPMTNNILVVDDEIGALTLIGIMLERGGFSVLKAKDGSSALAVLDQNIPDMIILDVMMPGMSGIELCQVIREREDTQNIPVLILSARGDADSVMQGMEAGANDYLPKPILHHDLVAKVKDILEEKANS